MTNEEIAALFAPLYGSFQNILETNQPPSFLAHYTSLEVLEKIMRTNEIWFSNPLFMNDLQEMRFGMFQGLNAFDEFSRESEFANACGTQERAAIIQNAFHGFFHEFDAKHALDVYVFCLSEHAANNIDGLLSMWRGYGANGNGAALVFKTDFLTLKPGSPLFFVKVHYASEEERIGWMKKCFKKCVEILRQNEVTDDQLGVVANNMFTLMKIYSLASKHNGFLEEQEWRIIYLPERDTNRLLAPQFSYIIGKNGVEPKLRFKIEPLKIEPPETWTFHSILHQIILGPSLSSTISVNTVRKMFELLNKPEFIEKLSASGIPLRPAI